MSIKGIDKLLGVMQKLQVRQEVIDQLNGAEFDLKSSKTFVPGPFLHQDVKDKDGDVVVTEKESAKFEKDNQELFNMLRHLKTMVDRTLL